MKWKQFIKSIFVGLVFIGSGLKAMFVRGESGLPYISSEDMPPIPPVKSPREDDVDKSLHLVGTDDYVEVEEEDIKFEGDFNIWGHFVCNKVGVIEEIFVDDKKVFSFVISSVVYDIKNYRREQIGSIVKEEFWFRKKGIINK